ncbi:MAG: hypothetical protein GY906_37030 [bacterium]|nr:hypothetical protein [bacterium]
MKQPKKRSQRKDRRTFRLREMTLDNFYEWFLVETKGGCWEYQGDWNRRYPRHGRQGPVHRVAFVLHFGPIENGDWVCHTCDNTRCGNPTHLYRGSPKQNACDTKMRGRHARLKIHQDQVLRIHRLLDDGVGAKEIAAEYELHSDTIYRIKSGAIWPEIREFHMKLSSEKKQKGDLF